MLDQDGELSAIDEDVDCIDEGLVFEYVCCCCCCCCCDQAVGMNKDKGLVVEDMMVFI
jgi:hypothetical protein